MYIYVKSMITLTMTMKICMYIESRQGHAFRAMVSCLTKLLQDPRRPAHPISPCRTLTIENLELRALTQSMTSKSPCAFRRTLMFTSQNYNFLDYEAAVADMVVFTMERATSLHDVVFPAPSSLSWPLCSTQKQVVAILHYCLPLPDSCTVWPYV